MGHGRQARQDPRPARPDAEPEGRHDHLRPRPRGHAKSRPAASSSRSTRRDRPRRRRQGQLRGRRRSSTTWPRWSTPSTGPSRAGAKGQYLEALTIASTMGPGIRVDVPGVLAAPPPPEPHGRRSGRPPSAMTAERARHLTRIPTDRHRQPAPADRRTPPRSRDGRGLIRRTGSRTACGRGRRRARRGRTVPLHLTGGPRPCELRSLLRAPVQGPSQGPSDRRSGPTAARRSRAETGGPHAHRGQARDGRRAARGARRQPDDDRLRIPRPQGEGDRRDPARPAQAGRDVPGRQEPAACASPPTIGGGRRSSPLLIGPTAIAFGNDEAGDGEGGHGRDPAVQPSRQDHRRACLATRRSTPTA